MELGREHQDDIDEMEDDILEMNRYVYLKFQKYMKNSDVLKIKFKCRCQICSFEFLNFLLTIGNGY